MVLELLLSARDEERIVRVNLEPIEHELRVGQTLALGADLIRENEGFYQWQNTVEYEVIRAFLELLGDYFPAALVD